MLPTPKAKTGRVLLVFVFFQLFLVLVLAPPAVIYLNNIDDASAYRKVFTVGFLGLVVFGSLGFLMWKGFGWARWVSSFLLFAIPFIVLALFVGDVKGTARLALIAVLVYQLILAAFLAGSTALEQFIREQERNRLFNR